MTTLLANPPMGIYKGPLNLGQAAYHVWIDFTHRALELKGEIVITPKRSLNIFGRRAELSPEMETPEQHAIKTLESYLCDTTLDKLSLRSSGMHLDTDPAVITSTKAFLNRINANKYLLIERDDLFLDVSAIIRRNDIENIINSIAFHPTSQKAEMISLLETATKEPLKITNNTLHSVRSDFSEKNLSPIFIATNSWEVITAERVIMPMSYNVLAKYGLLRILSSIAADVKPAVDEIYTYPRVKNGVWSEETKLLLESDIGRDIFRYTCAKIHTINGKQTAFDMTLLKGGEKLAQLIGNLNRYLPNVKPENSDLTLRIISLTLQHQYSTCIQLLETELRTLSKKINIAKVNNNSAQKYEFAKQFHGLLPAIGIFMPNIVSRCEGYHDKIQR